MSSNQPLIFRPDPTPRALVFRPATGNGAQGLQGIPGPPGPAGVNAAGIQGILSNAPGGSLTAAVGNGVADDTAALQGQIRAATDQFLPSLLTRGLYRLTAPLQQCLPSQYDLSSGTVNSSGGWLMRGLAGANDQQNALTGVTLQLSGTAQDAVLQLGKGAAVQSVLSDLTLSGGSGGTKCALHTVWNYWSGLRADNVRFGCGDVDIGVWIDGALGGANGEFFNAVNCNFAARKICYKNSSPSGQALIHTLTACHGGNNVNGGINFEMGGSSGIQTNVFGWSSTQTPGPLANVFLSLLETSGAQVFVGGRCEIVGTVLKWTGGSANLSAKVAISGYDFAGMQQDKPLFQDDGSSASYKFTLRSCTFATNATGAAQTPLLLSIAAGDKAQIILEDCDFGGWANAGNVPAGYAQIVNCPQVTLIRCRYYDAGLFNWQPLVHA